MALEEGYFTLLRGLPAGLALKGGKYRVGFGRLNPMHPARAAVRRPPAGAGGYLPGEESFNEIGVSLSRPHPAARRRSRSPPTGDWLQGDTFRIPRVASGDADPLALDPESGDHRPRRAGVRRQPGGFGMLGERSGVRAVGSRPPAARTTSRPARDERVMDAAAKAKLWTAANSYLLLQGEFLQLDREDAAWDSTAAALHREPACAPIGRLPVRRLQLQPALSTPARCTSATSGRPATDDRRPGLRGVRGLALMEETTAFRIDWNHFMPGTPAGGPRRPMPSTRVTLRVIFSMGPHKAHQF